MAAIKEWVRDLVMLAFLASMLELLLPMNGMKRFVRMAMGLLIVLGVVRPIATILRQPIRLDLETVATDGGPALPSPGQIAAQANRFRQQSEAMARQEAEAKLASAARQAARRVQGVAEAKAAVRTAAGNGSEYRLEGVTVTVRPGSHFGAVEPVEPVRTGGGDDLGGAGPGATAAEQRLIEAVRKEVAAELGLENAARVAVLIERPAQGRR